MVLASRPSSAVSVDNNRDNLEWIGESYEIMMPSNARHSSAYSSCSPNSLNELGEHDLQFPSILGISTS